MLKVLSEDKMLDDNNDRISHTVILYKRYAFVALAALLLSSCSTMKNVGRLVGTAASTAETAMIGVQFIGQGVETAASAVDDIASSIGGKREQKVQHIDDDIQTSNEGVHIIDKNRSFEKDAQLVTNQVHSDYQLEGEQLECIVLFRNTLDSTSH